MQPNVPRRRRDGATGGDPTRRRGRDHGVTRRLDDAGRDRRSRRPKAPGDRWPQQRGPSTATRRLTGPV
ncbi:MAG TPA: hypothetical protein PLG77_04040, partial [Burkholderiaceae bacterium]|nr:hypothetical protein [Burkholderiaceae bacterium]